MGWDNTVPNSELMTRDQVMEIIRLREIHDRVTPGTYAGDLLPLWDRRAASREIEKLKARISVRQYNRAR